MVEGWQARLPRPRLANLLLLSLLLHAVLYGRALRNGFTFDDHPIVVQSADVNGSAPLVGVLTRASFPGNFLDYRPVTLLSLGAEVRLFGLRPAPLRAMNILWAALGAALFASLAHRLSATRAVVWGALVLLACHPVRSEAIVSIVGRNELLAFAFVVLALLLEERPALSGAALLLALLSKENAFAAPLLLGAVLVSRTGTIRELFAAVRSRAPLLLSWGLALGVTFTLRRVVLGGFLSGPLAVVDPYNNPLHPLEAFTRMKAALSLLTTAAARLLFPSTLVADYGSNALDVALLLSPINVVSGAVILAGVVVVALALKRQAPLVAFGVLFAVLSYLPFANLLFPTGVAFAERLLYSPAAGVTLALVAAAAAMPPLTESLRDSNAASSLRPRILAFAVVSLSVLGAVRIQRRLPEWRNDRALFRAVLDEYPGNGRAWMHVAHAALSAGDRAAAEAAFRGACQAHPGLGRAILLMGIEEARAGRAANAGVIVRALRGPDVRLDPEAAAILDGLEQKLSGLRPEGRLPGEQE